MTQSSLERAVGRLEGKVDQVLEEQKRANFELKENKQQQDAIRREQDRAANQRDDLSKRLATVEKNTADFNKWKERGVGALMLISAAAALIGGAFAASWQKVLEIFR